MGPVEKVASMVYTLSGVGWIAGKKLLCSTGSPVWHSVMTWRDGLVGGEGGYRGRGDVCVIMNDLCRCMAETNTIFF